MPFDSPYADTLKEHGFVPANHEKPVFFPVGIGPVYDDKGAAIPGYKRVERGDTGDTLAVHSDRYKLIPYEESFAAMEDALRASGLDLTDMQIGTDLSHNGARCFRQYLLPKYTFDVTAGDPVAFRIVMFNSYDGSCGFRGRAGAYRFVCANTSVIGTDFACVSTRHVGGADIAPVLEGLVNEAEAYITNIERMKRWVGKRVDTDRLPDVLKAIPQSTQRLVEHLTTAFVTQDDRSLWGLYNVLTAWSSHTAAKANIAQVRADREVRVAKVIDADAWRVLEDA